MKTLILILLLAVTAYAKDPGFDTFIAQLNNSAPDKRAGLVEKYMAAIGSTPIIEGKDKVHFVWYGKADTVKVEGELQKAWAIPAILSKIDCGEKDFFHISYTVPADAILQYGFIVDGKSILDPKSTNFAQGFDFGDRNFFSMPEFKPSPNLANRHGINKGQVMQWTYKTKHEMFTNQPIWIYLPYGYSKEKKYPALYVLDGIGSLYSRPFLNVINNLIHDGKIEPIVVVFTNFEDRWNEYVEHSPEYAKFMAEEIVPFIGKNFSVEDSPDKRGIIGASASGHGAAVIGLRHSDVFGNVASQGGGAGGYPGLNPKANEALDVYLTRKDKYPLRRFYTEVGAFDLEFPRDKIVFAEGVYQFNGRLKENNIPFEFNKVNSGHNSTIWDQSLDRILLSFFGK
jgi:enterochelin esterase-like enzyme